MKPTIHYSKQGVRVPSPAALRTYGLSEKEWLALLDAQGGVCAVCEKIPPNGRLCTDHEHVPGWKKMAPFYRKRYVRGMLCFFCNHYYVGRAITVAKARNVLTYLEAYQCRKLESERRELKTTKMNQLAPVLLLQKAARPAQQKSIPAPSSVIGGRSVSR